MDLSKSVAKFDMTPPAMKDWWSKIEDGGKFTLTIHGVKLGTTGSIGEASITSLEPEGMPEESMNPSENPEEEGTVTPSDAEPVAVLITGAKEKKKAPPAAAMPMAMPGA